MRESTKNDYTRRILAVLRHIQDHLDEELSPVSLAREAHFSPTHFHRVFKGMLGESLMEHVRRLRLERAARNLEFTGRPVTDIGLEAGYDTLEAFSRSFKALFDEPPSRYREAQRKARPGGTDSLVHYLPLDERGSLNFKPRSVIMDVTIKTIDSMRVAYARHTGPYAECGEAWNRLCGWAGPKGLLGPQTRFFGQSHDDPQVTPPDKLRYDACIGVPDNVRPEGEIGVMDIFGGEWAVYLHAGPYEGLMEVYNNLYGGWLPGSGREYRDGPAVEEYLNHPDATPAEELRTLVHLPLK